MQAAERARVHRRTGRARHRRPGGAGGSPGRAPPGRDIAAIARENGKSEDHVRQILADPSARIDARNRLYYVDPVPPSRLWPPHWTFNVDVTTQEPSADAITRSSSSDLVYGTRALITDATEIRSGCGCGGIAYR